MRNPLYFFSSLGFIGAGLTFGSTLITLLLVFTFAITHIPIILYEERRLLSYFGDDLETIWERVPKDSFPKIIHYLINSKRRAKFLPKGSLPKSVERATLLIILAMHIRVIVWVSHG